ncbi:hypothetical protein D9M68_886870 [compost metagenome]
MRFSGLICINLGKLIDKSLDRITDLKHFFSIINHKACICPDEAMNDDVNDFVLNFLVAPGIKVLTRHYVHLSICHFVFPIHKRRPNWPANTKACHDHSPLALVNLLFWIDSANAEVSRRTAA